MEINYKSQQRCLYIVSVFFKKNTSKNLFFYIYVENANSGCWKTWSCKVSYGCYNKLPQAYIVAQDNIIYFLSPFIPPIPSFTRDGTHSMRICLNWELHLPPLTHGMTIQTAEPHWPGLSFSFFFVPPPQTSSFSAPSFSLFSS